MQKQVCTRAGNRTDALDLTKWLVHVVGFIINQTKTAALKKAKSPHGDHTHVCKRISFTQPTCSRMFLLYNIPFTI